MNRIQQGYPGRISSFSFRPFSSFSLLHLPVPFRRHASGLLLRVRVVLLLGPVFLSFLLVPVRRRDSNSMCGQRPSRFGQPPRGDWSPAGSSALACAGASRLDTVQLSFVLPRFSICRGVLGTFIDSRAVLIAHAHSDDSSSVVTTHLCGGPSVHLAGRRFGSVQVRFRFRFRFRFGSGSLFGSVLRGLQTRRSPSGSSVKESESIPLRAVNPAEPRLGSD